MLIQTVHTQAFGDHFTFAGKATCITVAVHDLYVTGLNSLSYKTAGMTSVFASLSTQHHVSISQAFDTLTH